MSESKQYTKKELQASLNEQNQRFCEAKLFNNNVQSYMIAYPDCEYKSASASATRLLENVRIQQYIELLKNDIEDITGVSKIRNVAELAKIAYSCIDHLHETWIDLKEWEDIKKDNPEAMAAIESIDTKTEQKLVYSPDLDSKENIDVKYVKIKLFSKTTAIDMINKMMGYNEPDKVDHTSKGESLSNLAGTSTDELVKRAQAIDKLTQKQDQK